MTTLALSKLLHRVVAPPGLHKRSGEDTIIAAGWNRDHSANLYQFIINEYPGF